MILTTLHVECVVFRREAHQNGRRRTSVCVLKTIVPRIRQVAWLAEYSETHEQQVAALLLNDVGVQRSVVKAVERT